MTRKLVALGLLTAGLGAVGCGGDYVRARQLRGSGRPDDPRLPIDEQESRGRARYAIPEDDPAIGPRTFTDRPDPVSGGARGSGPSAGSPR